MSESCLPPQIPEEVASTIQELTQPLALEQLARGLLVLGGLIFAVSVFGYCGASKESRFLLTLVRKNGGDTGQWTQAPNYGTAAGRISFGYGTVRPSVH